MPLQQGRIIDGHKLAVKPNVRYSCKVFRMEAKTPTLLMYKEIEDKKILTKKYMPNNFTKIHCDKKL